MATETRGSQGGQESGRGRAAYYMVRDLIQWLAGLGIIGHQVLYAKEPSWEYLAVALVLIGVPGAIGLANVLLSAKGNTTSTTAAPSSSQSSSLQQPSS